MKKVILILTAALGSGCLLFSFAYQGGQDSESQTLDERIRQVENGLAGRVQIAGQETHNIYDRMAHFHIPGVSIAVIDDYKIAWAKGYGLADQESKQPVTTTTCFHAASISKTVNAVGVLLLVQNGRVALDLDINTYLTSWKFPYDSVSNGKKISVSSLLSHTAGLSNSGPMYHPEDVLPTVLQDLQGTQPSFAEPVHSIMEPNQRFSYSNPGIGITQVLVGDVTGLPYATYMQENVLGPLGMENSMYTEESLRQHQKSLAAGHRQSSLLPGRRVVVPMSAAGGLWTTPTDLARLICELQLAYAGKSTKFISQETARRMVTPSVDPMVGLGLFLEQRAGTTYFQHSGHVSGFKSQYYASLEGGHGVVIMVNSDNPSTLAEEIANSVATAYRWKGFYTPLHKQAVSLPDSLAEQCLGIYMPDPTHFTSIVKKKDGLYLFADGAYDKIYFSSPDDFFHPTFTTEKHLLRDPKGSIIGYERWQEGTKLGIHNKVLEPSSITGDDQLFTNIGWNCLENGSFAQAMAFFERGLELHPNSLYLLCNGAHAFLFNGRYEVAIDIYKRHRDHQITDKIIFRDMVRDDFVFFNSLGFDRSAMDKVIHELQLEMPAAYNNR